MAVCYILIFVDSVDVTVNVVSSAEIFVSWVTPQSITDQAVSLYQVAVTSVCSTQGVFPTQLFTISPQEASSLNVSGLGKLYLQIYQEICVMADWSISAQILLLHIKLG